jgi:hypothetical protein
MLDMQQQEMAQMRAELTQPRSADAPESRSDDDDYHSGLSSPTALMASPTALMASFRLPPVVPTSPQVSFQRPDIANLVTMARRSEKAADTGVGISHGEVESERGRAAQR